MKMMARPMLNFEPHRDLGDSSFICLKARSSSTVRLTVMAIYLHSADYSCSYHKKLTNQGWLYISNSYICFYSFVLGIETKVVIELKDISDLKKEKSKSGVFSDAIKIVTKSNQEVFDLSDDPPNFLACIF
jgi:hypothetical protein